MGKGLQPLERNADPVQMRMCCMYACNSGKNLAAALISSLVCEVAMLVSFMASNDVEGTGGGFGVRLWRRRWRCAWSRPRTMAWKSGLPKRWKGL